MKTKLYLEIAARIILLMVIGCLWTYITPALHDFLGDVGHTIKTHHEYNPNYGPKFDPYDSVEIDYDWGVRHYWYFYGMLLLFLLTLTNSIISIIKSAKKHYPNL